MITETEFYGVFGISIALILFMRNAPCLKRYTNLLERENTEQNINYSCCYVRDNNGSKKIMCLYK